MADVDFSSLLDDLLDGAVPTEAEPEPIEAEPIEAEPIKAVRSDNLAINDGAIGDELIVDAEPIEGARVLAISTPTSGTLAQIRTGSGVPTQELTQFLAPQRAGDPLGIGIKPGERPPAPPDPDVYDRAREDAEYARSLLSEQERAEVDAEIAKDGYLSIEEVRALITENTVKGSVEVGGLDPEIMALVDARINYKIFVAGDNVYSREGLYDHFPFHEFNVQPEAIFVQQEIGIFPPRKHALADELEYIARDAGDESVDFVMIEDLVGQAARKNYKNKRAPYRVVKTKIYIGKERWEDFSLMQRFFRGAARVASAQLAYGGGVPSIFTMLTGPQGASPLMIADTATVEAERKAREEEIARREEELRRREEENRRAEEEARRLAAETQRRIDADLRRVEEMLATAAELRAQMAAERAARAVAQAAAANPDAARADAANPGADEDDSVAI
jgi:hypothetical protein